MLPAGSPCIGTVGIVLLDVYLLYAAGLTVYSGVMFGRLRLAVPNAVLFGDIGQAAFGRLVISLLLCFYSVQSG